VWLGAEGPAAGGVTGGVKRDTHDFEPIWGLGTEFDLIEGETIHARPLALYGNVSTGYRPATFGEGVGNPSSVSLSSDLTPAHSTSGEVGLRSTAVPWHIEDLSVFHMIVDDQIGTFGGLVRNVGTTEHHGLEWFQQTDLFALADWMQKGEAARPAPWVKDGKVGFDREGWGRAGSLNLYSALSFLQAEITASPTAEAVGRNPQFAPDFTARYGLEYNYIERFKSSLQATYIGPSVTSATPSDFAAGNSAVLAHHIWDWSMEFYPLQDYVSIFFGINNLFDSRYEARTRGGIDPAPERNYYGGVKIAY